MAPRPPRVCYPCEPLVYVRPLSLEIRRSLQVSGPIVWMSVAFPCHYQHGPSKRSRTECRLQKHELPTVSHLPLRSACGPANSHDDRIIVCSSRYTNFQTQDVSSEAMKSIACVVRSPALRRECLGLILRIHPDPWSRSTQGPWGASARQDKGGCLNYLGMLDRSRKCQLPYLEVCLLSIFSA